MEHHPPIRHHDVNAGRKATAHPENGIFHRGPEEGADRHTSSDKTGDSAYLRGTGLLVRTSLQIGAPNDEYEQEAEQMAARVTAGKTAEDEEGSMKHIQRDPSGEPAGGATLIGVQPKSKAAAPVQRMESEAVEEQDAETEVGGFLDEAGGSLAQEDPEPVQTKLKGYGLVQRMPAPIQRTDKKVPKVPIKIYFEGTLNQEQFKQAAMKQLFGGPVTGLEWTLSRTSYTSPTVLMVAVSLLKSQRGQANTQKGIPTGADGGVTGSGKLREDFKKMSSGAAKEDIYKEIDRRYYEASGDAPGTKLTGSAADAGKRELWMQIQDEVLFQNEYVKNLPETVKKFIKYSTNGKILTAKDLEQMFRIAKTIENLPVDIAHDYLSRVSGETIDLDKFEASLHTFREEIEKQKLVVEENNVIKGQLMGFEELYKRYRTYVSLLKSSATLSGMAMGPHGGMAAGTGLGGSMEAMKQREQLDADCKASGFAGGISDFEKYIKQFEAGFEKQAQLTAIGYIEKLQGRLYKEQAMFQDTAAMTDLLARIQGGASKESLQETYSVFNDKDLPDDKKVSMDRLKTATTAAGLGSMMASYAATRIADVKAAKGEIAADSKVIFKLTKMLPVFYLEQEIAPGSIFDMIIQDKIKSDAILKLVVGIALAIAAIALAVVSLGAGIPAIAAAGAAALGFGISAHAVYEEYKNYALGKKLANAGFADDPSIVWLVIAVAGAMLDMGAAARALSKLGPAAKTLQAGGDLAEFRKVVKAMQEAGELDAKAAAAIEKAAMAQKAYQESKAAFDTILAGGSKSFADPRMYAELVKMAKFKSMQGAYSLIAFVNDIKAARKLKGLPDLSTDEIAKIRQAWEEGRATARVAGETLEATDDMVRTLKSSIEARITGNPKFALTYTEAELKAIITKGRANGLSPKEIEDLIFVGSRKEKALNAIQLMDQMDFALYLKGRGFPMRFGSLDEFKEFSATLKSEISTIGGPTNDIRIQGSSLRSAAAQDVDLVAMMPESVFDDIIKKAYAGKLKENGAVVDLMSLDNKGLVDLLARIKANPKSFNGIRRDFEYVFGNKMINSKMMKSEIKAVFDAEGVLARIQAKYPHLNIENVSFQIPGGAFDLQPFLRL